MKSSALERGMPLRTAIVDVVFAHFSIGMIEFI